MSIQKIVTVGGGTGSFTLLSGLKKYPVQLSAVVSMADDGGSTGVLRDELGVLPPGDVRQCLVALSESSENMRKLMNYRFEEGSLRGHSFGNLFLSALEKISGGFSQGVEEAMRILKVVGEVIPVTDQDIRLVIHLGTGRILEGEDQINKCDFQRYGVKEVTFSTQVSANAKALKRVARADAIVIGPGNHYCSILPNVAVKDFAQAIRESRGKVVYVCNLTNKKGHTSGWDVDDYVDSLEHYIGRGRVDYVIYNVKKPRRDAIEEYERSEGRNSLVVFRREKNPKRTYRLVNAYVASDVSPHYPQADTLAQSRALIRHDSTKLAQAILFLLEFAGKRGVVRDME